MEHTLDEREEELESLTAIFPEIEIHTDDRFSFLLEITVTPNKALDVTFSPPETGNGSSQPKDTHTLSHMPSVLLDMTLPHGYPETKPPDVRLSNMDPAWIPKAKLEELENEASKTWQEYGHAQMAYDYIDSLQQAAERAFDLSKIVLNITTKAALLAFNAAATKKIFDAETFDCGICLDPKKGAKCHRLHKCSHVFCVDCLRSAYDSAIAEGDVSSVKCLFPDCGVERDSTTRRATKAAPTLGPDELVQIPIARKAVERYVQLKRKKRFESFPKTVYCPRKWCQGIAMANPKRHLRKPVEEITADDLKPEAILSEKDAEPTNLPMNKDRLRICEDCELAFCRVCLATWHGEYVTRCWPRTTDELSEEEQASYNYLRQHTTPCPTCDFAIQKSMGCNHITCFNCKNHFCYLCSAWLNPADPYIHFGKPNTPCYQRLWDLEGGDDGDGNIEFLGIRGAEAAAIAAEIAEQEQLAAQQPAPEPNAPEAEMAALNINDAPELPAQPEALQDPQIRFDLFDDFDDWAPPPAHWRNHGYEPAPPGRPRRQNPRPAVAGFRAAPVPAQQNQAARRAAARQDARVDGAGAARPPPREEVAEAGLQRFLAMAAEDREDEWDSDELEGEDEVWAIPMAPVRVPEQLPPRGGRRGLFLR